MKLKFILFYPLIFSFLFLLNAEKATEAIDADVEEELPEYSDPPYKIGDRAVIQGCYVPLEEGISLNFRILNNRAFVYWVDEDDLIVEPGSNAGNIRIIAKVRGPGYFQMKALENEDGLGSVGSPLFKPYIFTIVLSLEKADSDDLDSYTFRYTPAMEASRETRDVIVADDSQGEGFSY